MKTRRGHNLSIPLHRTTLFNVGPHYKCIKIYNSLQPKVKNAVNIHAFKNEIKDFLIATFIYLVVELY